MKLIVNDALTPVRTRILGPGAIPETVAENFIIIPGRGWRRVADSEMTDDLRAAIAAGTLHVMDRAAQ